MSCHVMSYSILSGSGRSAGSGAGPHYSGLGTVPREFCGSGCHHFGWLIHCQCVLPGVALVLCASFAINCFLFFCSFNSFHCALMSAMFCIFYVYGHSPIDLDLYAQWKLMPASLPLTHWHFDTWFGCHRNPSKKKKNTLFSLFLLDAFTYSWMANISIYRILPSTIGLWWSGCDINVC